MAALSVSLEPAAEPAEEAEAQASTVSPCEAYSNVQNGSSAHDRAGGDGDSGPAAHAAPAADDHDRIIEVRTGLETTALWLI